MTRETEAVLNMLNEDDELKGDLLDRFTGRDLLDEEAYSSTVSELSFVLEDELRASASLHFINVSMWKELVMPYIENADYKEISDVWLSRIRDRRKEING